MADDIYWNWLETYQGNKFDLKNLDENVYDPVDIAHALSMQCRYAGHCAEFYSIAEHSWLIALWLQSQGCSLLTQLQGLMHDATEAYITDLPRDLKLMLPDYKALENRLEAVIFERFNIPLPMHPLIKQADTRILVNERDRLFHGARHSHWEGGVGLAGVDVYCWSPQRAKTLWLRRFEFLIEAIAEEEKINGV